MTRPRLSYVEIPKAATSIQTLEELISTTNSFSNSPNEEISEMVMEEVEPIKEISPPPKKQSPLDVAADLLLDQLTLPIRDFAFELADIQLHIPRWHLLLGSLLAQYQSGTLAAPSIDPSWMNDVPHDPTSICEQCNQPFSPKRIGQRFCSNKCGNVWDRKFGRGANRA